MMTQKAAAKVWLDGMPVGSVYYMAEINAGGAVGPDQPFAKDLLEQMGAKVLAEVAGNEPTRRNIIVGFVVIPANEDGV